MPYQPFQYFVRLRAVISPVVPLIPSEYWQNNSLIKHYCLLWIAIDSSVDVTHTRVSFRLEMTLLESQFLCVRISDSSPFFSSILLLFFEKYLEQFFGQQAAALSILLMKFPMGCCRWAVRTVEETGKPFLARVVCVRNVIIAKKVEWHGLHRGTKDQNLVAGLKLVPLCSVHSITLIQSECFQIF